jgi:aspartyl-tRNA(Asn)/glutamyl-tRNA(Gln) amidotransferase subunit A
MTKPSKTAGSLPGTAKASAVAATRDALARIERANPSLQAFVTITGESALAAAAAADRIAAAGGSLPLLSGMPVAVKDIIDVAGLPTQAGSLTRATVRPAVTDAPVVARLREAGAVVVGKTHTVEFAFGGWGTNVTVGTPRNPRDRKLHRVPGGSSSGSGVAVAAGLVPAALGSDTGGSVRIPAALNGCVGLKTSIGLMPRTGAVPLSETFDTIGPLAVDVTTAARVTAAMIGPDAADASTHGVPAPDLLRDLERGAAGLRIGRLADDDMPLTTAEVRSDFARSIHLLEEAGATIVPLRLPEALDFYMRCCGVIMAAEGYAHGRALVDDPKSPLADPIRTRLLVGKTVTAADYLEAQRARRRAIIDVLAAIDRLDAFVLPTVPITAIAVAEVDEGQTPLGAHTRFINYLELASLAVPIALTQAGLPTSLQIAVRRFDDGLALRIGRAFEVVRGSFPLATV